MLLQNFLASNKPMVEKLRILLLRLRKKIYIVKSMWKMEGRRQKCNTINTNFFFINKSIVLAYTLQNKKVIIHEADKIVNNLYRDISGRTIEITGSINWNYDYVFGYLWNSQHYSKYILKNKNTPTDVKHVWELSRFYHLVVLAQAYTISDSNEYLDKIFEDIYSWEEQNPFNYSVNWTVSMEVAIRVVNLIQTITLITQSIDLSDDKKNRINNIIHKHGEYLWNNLEKGLNTNNHYLSNLVGLIWIAIYFRESKSSYFTKLSRKYLDFSIKQLNYELKYQIYDDGFSYEDSVSYHALNTEMLLLTVDVLDTNKISYPKSIRSTVEKMITALQKVMIGNRIPLIGDIDNGRLIIYDITSNRDKTEFGYLINTAKQKGLLLENQEFPSPIKLENAGIYRIFNDTFDVIVKCGQIGLNGIGGHAHNDQLSFVLNIFGQQIVIDPGTGYYSGNYELRRQLRSTDSHNTLCIGSYEQNNIDIDLFKMVEKTYSTVQSASSCSFEGRHFGYFKSHGIIYKRKITISGNEIRIVDTIDHPVNEECYINYILDEDVVLGKQEKTGIEIKKNGLSFKLEVRGGNITLTDQYISKSYGEVNITKKVRVTMESNELVSVIRLV